MMFRALNVVKRFGPTVALDGVSVEFGSGLNLLLGPNGSGKSTLLKLWCGLIRPTRGRVEVFGLDPWARRVDVMKRVSAFFEDVPAPWWFSGEEFLRIVAEKRGVDWGIVREYAERLGVTGYWRKLIRGYSSGMRKKVMLLAALVADVDGYMLDEPYTLLDKDSVRVVDEIIAEKVRSGKIVVVASHILTGVERFAKGFAILHNGKVVARYPGEAVEIPTIIECPSKDASRIVEEAQKLNPSKIVVSKSAIYIHTTSAQQVSSFVESFGCVAYPDIATMYSEVVKA
jgi:ABC-type multidrug transport system ATPase subunit